MAIPQHDAGPMFPQSREIGSLAFTGASLRDFFAVHAPPMPEQWYLDGRDDMPGLSWAQLDAEWRFHHADLMLKARQGS